MRADYYRKSPGADPLNVQLHTNADRVTRGGTWTGHSADLSVSAARGAGPHGLGRNAAGFPSGPGPVESPSDRLAGRKAGAVSTARQQTGHDHDRDAARRPGTRPNARCRGGLEAPQKKSSTPKAKKSAAGRNDAEGQPQKVDQQHDRDELTLIPAGEFLMGSSESDKDAKVDEKPQHRVRIHPAVLPGRDRGHRRPVPQRCRTPTGYKTEAEKDGKGGAGLE